MESMPVNWDVLDALVMEYAESENLLHQTPSMPFSSSSPSSSPSSVAVSYVSRLAIYRIQRLIEMGDIDAAIELLRIHAPAVLENHRLLFRLQKQKFVELLRKGSMEERNSAIKCLRTTLAPCALDAYPEAYEEFKHVLLAFIYDKDDNNSPVANEWSDIRRVELAASLSSVLRDHLQAYDPLFSMTLRYLVSTHKEFSYRKNVASPISDIIIENILLKERDPPATPQESLFEIPPYDEVDVQALAHAVQISRQEAVDSLRYAKGDLFRAFQNELCRMKLDISLVDKLVYEYCIYRGLLDIGTSASGKISKTHALEVEFSFFNENFSLTMDRQMNHLNVEISFDGTDKEGTPETNSSWSTRTTDAELRFGDEIMDDQENCSTSESNKTENLPARLSCACYGSRERTRQKRWKGRIERPEDIIAEVIIPQDSKDRAVPDIIERAPGKNVDSEGLKNEGVSKYDIIFGIKELARMGMTTKVVEEINLLDAHFFEQNPGLLFHLKQVEFLKLIECGDHANALRVASAYLGPIAANNTSFLKPLKETLLALLGRKEEIHAKTISLSNLATLLQHAIGRSLGIEEPQLMKIMRATLFTHDEWFKLQMCHDRFEGLLKIDQLKEVDGRSFGDAYSQITSSTGSYGSQITISGNKETVDNGDQIPGSSRDVICEEAAILKVMEFLALPRSDAIQLLAQYNGNAENAILNFLSDPVVRV